VPEKQTVSSIIPPAKPVKEEPSTAQQYGGLFLKGLLMSTVASTQSEEDKLIEGKKYRPAIVDQLGATINLGKMGLDLGRTALGYEATDPLDPNGYVAKSVERLGAANDRINEDFGINNAENALQLATEIGGGLVVPAKVPRVGKIGAPGRAIDAASTKLKSLGVVGKTVNGVNKVVFELAVPLRNTKLSVAVPANQAFGIGIQETVDGVLRDVDEYEENDVYNGVIDYLANSSTVAKPEGDFYPKELQTVFTTYFNKGYPVEELAAMMDQQGYEYDLNKLTEQVAMRDQMVADRTFQPVEVVVAPEDAEAFQRAIEKKGIYTTVPDIQRLSRMLMGVTIPDGEAARMLKEIQTNTAIAMGDVQDKTPEYKDQKTADRLSANSPLEPVDDEVPSIELEPWQAGAIALAVTLGGYKVYRSIESRIGNILNPPSDDTSIGHYNLPSKATIMQKISAGYSEGDRSIKDVARLTMPVEQANEIIATKNLVNNAGAIGAKTSHVLKTGEFPNSSVRARPIGPLMESYGKNLTPQQKQVLNDALTAATALDDRKQVGYKASAAFTTKSTTELQARVNLAIADPQLKQHLEGTQGVYADTLKYLHNMNMISTADYNKIRAESPNYAPLKKNATVEGLEPKEAKNTEIPGDGAIEGLYSRSKNEDYSSVQDGEAFSPIEYIPTMVTKAVKAAEENKFRHDFLSRIDPSFTVKDSLGNNIPIIRKLPVKSASKVKDKEKAIATYSGDGEVTYWQINQGDLYEALKFSPKQVDEVFNTMRSVQQTFTTGVGNLAGYFRMAISPFFDSQTAIVARPTGTQLGLFSELFNKMGIGTKVAGVDLTALDPSAHVAFLTGGIRGLQADIAGAMANAMTSGMMRRGGVIKDALDTKGAIALRDVLQKHYDMSIRAMIDAEGASSASGLGSGLEHKVDIGLEGIAPDLAKQIALRDVKEATGAFDTMLKASKVPLVYAKAGSIGRTYNMLLRNLQDGTRIQYVAANMPNVKNVSDYKTLMGRARAIVADPAQSGKGTVTTKLNSTVLYHNIAVQEAATYAAKMKADPVGFLTNLTAGILYPAIALHYAPLVMGDEEAVAKNDSRNPAQKGTSITTFGGVEIPVNPSMRVMIGPIINTLDQLMMAPDGTIDPNFAKLIIDWFEDDIPEGNIENAQAAVGQAARSGLTMLAPTGDGSAIPLANTVASLANVDLPASMMFDEAVSPRTAGERNPLAGEGELTDSMFTAYWKNVVSSTIGAGAETGMMILDDIHRATNPDKFTGKQPTSWAGGLRIGQSRVLDAVTSMNSPLEGLMPQATQDHSIYGPDFQIVKDKQNALDNLRNSFNRNIRDAGFTGVSTASGKNKNMPSVVEQDLPDLSGTALDWLGQQVLGEKSTYGLTTKLNKWDKQYSNLTAQMQDVKNSKVTTIQERNRAINEINVKRLAVIEAKRMLIADVENKLRPTLGDGFTFNNLTPKYLEELAKTPLP